MKYLLLIALVVAGCGNEEKPGDHVRRQVLAEGNDAYHIDPESIPPEVKEWMHQQNVPVSHMLQLVQDSLNPPDPQWVLPKVRKVYIRQWRQTPDGWRPPGWAFVVEGVPYLPWESPKDQPMVEKNVRVAFDSGQKRDAILKAIDAELRERHHLDDESFKVIEEGTPEDEEAVRQSDVKDAKSEVKKR